MSTTFHIGRATSRDIVALSKVHVDAWHSTYRGIVPQEYLDSLSLDDREQRWRQAFAENRSHWHVFVVKDAAANVIGFSCGGETRGADSPYDGEVYAIYLRKEFHGKGIGKKLFFTSLEQLLRDGFTSCSLWVLDLNPTRGFYEAMGGENALERWEEIGGKQLREIGYVWPDIRQTLKAKLFLSRHECIKHFSEIQELDNAHYPGSDELLSRGSPFGRFFGFPRLGIHHELLKPGRRTSWPHAEKTEDEFCFVIEGTPDVWLDGELYRLHPGDGVGFRAGVGLAHTFINNTDSDVRLLGIGDTTREDNQCVYPMDPKRNAEIREFLWDDAPKRKLGPHDGLPDTLRKKYR